MYQSVKLLYWTIWLICIMIEEGCQEERKGRANDMFFCDDPVIVVGNELCQAREVMKHLE